MASMFYLEVELELKLFKSLLNNGLFDLEATADSNENQQLRPWLDFCIDNCLQKKPITICAFESVTFSQKSMPPQ